MLSVSSKQWVHARYPLFVCPKRLLNAGQSLMVTNNNARRLKISCLSSSHTSTPSSFQSCKRSSTNGLRYTSMSLQGYFGPWISTDILMNFHCMHNQGERLNLHRITGQVLWPLHNSPNGLNPSVFKPNLMFLASLSKFRNALSIDLHWAPSAGCLSI